MSKIKPQKPSKKKMSDGIKIAIILTSIVLVIVITIICIYFTRKGSSKNKTQFTDNTIGQLQKYDNKGVVDKTVDSNNEIDTSKSKPSNSSNPNSDKQGNINISDMKKMSKEEKDKLLKNTINNSQSSKPNEPLSKDDKDISQLKLGFDPKYIMDKPDFVNFKKRTTKTDDRTFILWLECLYENKPYTLIIKPSDWDYLKDEGILPVTVHYYIDKNNQENCLGISIRDNYKSLMSK